VALAHNILKVAGIRQLLSGNDPYNTKVMGGRRAVFLPLLYFRDLSDSLLLTQETNNISL